MICMTSEMERIELTQPLPEECEENNSKIIELGDDSNQCSSPAKLKLASAHPSIGTLPHFFGSSFPNPEDSKFIPDSNIHHSQNMEHVDPLNANRATISANVESKTIQSAPYQHHKRSSSLVENLLFDIYNRWSYKHSRADSSLESDTLTSTSDAPIGWSTTLRFASDHNNIGNVPDFTGGDKSAFDEFQDDQRTSLNIESESNNLTRWNNPVNRSLTDGDPARFSSSPRVRSKFSNWRKTEHGITESRGITGGIDKLYARDSMILLENRRLFSFENLMKTKNNDDLKAIIRIIEHKIQIISSRLIKQLKRRDHGISKTQKHCDLLTAILQAASLKRREDTKLKFILEPQAGEEAFQQWLEAMRGVVRLPLGLPSEMRKKVWLTLANHHITSKHYDWDRTVKICFNDRSNQDDDHLGLQIVKDLHRTGCDRFSSEADRAVLKRVLLAYARWNKRVGYCQGFNVLAALLLEVTERCEESAFKLMIYLVDHVLPESFFAQNLQALSVDMAVFRDLLKIHMPKLATHLERLQQQASSSSCSISTNNDLNNNTNSNSNRISKSRSFTSGKTSSFQFGLLTSNAAMPSNKYTGNGNSNFCQPVRSMNNYEPPLTNVFTMQWFLTLFATCLPADQVLRLWDSIMLEGSEMIIRTAIVIWSCIADRILKIESADSFYSEMSSICQDLADGNLIEAEQLINRIYVLPVAQAPCVSSSQGGSTSPSPHSLIGSSSSSTVVAATLATSAGSTGIATIGTSSMTAAAADSFQSGSAGSTSIIAYLRDSYTYNITPFSNNNTSMSQQETERLKRNTKAKNKLPIASSASFNNNNKQGNKSHSFASSIGCFSGWIPSSSQQSKSQRSRGGLNGSGIAGVVAGSGSVITRKNSDAANLDLVDDDDDDRSSSFGRGGRSSSNGDVMRSEVGGSKGGDDSSSSGYTGGGGADLLPIVGATQERMSTDLAQLEAQYNRIKSRQKKTTLVLNSSSSAAAAATSMLPNTNAAAASNPHRGITAVGIGGGGGSAKFFSPAAAAVTNTQPANQAQTFFPGERAKNWSSTSLSSTSTTITSPSSHQQQPPPFQTEMINHLFLSNQAAPSNSAANKKHTANQILNRQQPIEKTQITPRNIINNNSNYKSNAAQSGSANQFLPPVPIGLPTRISAPIGQQRLQHLGQSTSSSATPAGDLVTASSSAGSSVMPASSSSNLPPDLEDLIGCGLSDSDAAADLTCNTHRQQRLRSTSLESEATATTLMTSADKSHQVMTTQNLTMTSPENVFDDDEKSSNLSRSFNVGQRVASSPPPKTTLLEKANQFEKSADAPATNPAMTREGGASMNELLAEHLQRERSSEQTQPPITKDDNSPPHQCLDGSNKTAKWIEEHHKCKSSQPQHTQQQPIMAQPITAQLQHREQKVTTRGGGFGQGGFGLFKAMTKNRAARSNLNAALQKTYMEQLMRIGETPPPPPAAPPLRPF